MTTDNGQVGKDLILQLQVPHEAGDTLSLSVREVLMGIIHAGNKFMEETRWGPVTVAMSHSVTRLEEGLYWLSQALTLLDQIERRGR